MSRLIDRFESKVTKTNTCWNWNACHHARGYGLIYNGKHSSGKKMEYAHRVSYKLFIGDLKDDECVCHTCDNPKCVNPQHLFKGSHKDNMQDMVNKGRHKSGKQKLNQLDYEFARFMRENNVMIKDIAKYFNIDIGHASRVSR